MRHAVRLPRDAHGAASSKPGTTFAALEVGGVMRTIDGGESWKDCSPDLIRLAEKPHLKSKIVSDTSNEGMLDGHAIAISPADPDAVIVAVRMGLFRTADDGDTWQDMEVGRFSPTTYGRDIKASPRPARRSIGAERRRGEQGRCGLSQQGQGEDLAAVRQGAGARDDHVGGAASNDPKQVYIGARYDGEVFGTLDGGATWQSMNLPSGTKDIYSLACG